MWTWTTTCLRLMAEDNRERGEKKEGQTRAGDGGFKLIYGKYQKIERRKGTVREEGELKQ